MSSPPPDALKPRKRPRQARATVTVEAILQATVQVLLADGTARLTTTRVAERAGVSVGTLYQYFPHKRALLYAVLEHHLQAMARNVETACRHCRGRPLAVQSDGLVAAYLDAKIGEIEVSRALYAVATELDTTDLIGDVGRRLNDAFASLLTSAADARFDDPETVVFALRAVLAGTVRAVLEPGATPATLAALRSELPSICRAYLTAAARRPV